MNMKTLFGKCHLTVHKICIFTNTFDSEVCNKYKHFSLNYELSYNFSSATKDRLRKGKTNKLKNESCFHFIFLVSDNTYIIKKNLVAILN